MFISLSLLIKIQVPAFTKEEREARKLHEAFIKTLRDVYGGEMSLLQQESLIVRAFKKFEDEFISKGIFQKAKWKQVTRKAEYTRNKYKVALPNNTYAKIKTNFDVLMDALRHDIMVQVHIIDNEYYEARSCYKGELEKMKKMPLFRKTFGQTEKQAFY